MPRTESARKKMPVRGSYNVKSSCALPPVKRAPRNSRKGRPPNEGDEGRHCVICLDTRNLREDEEIVCGHKFHKNCINRWLTGNNSCPICRKPVNIGIRIPPYTCPRPQSPPGVRNGIFNPPRLLFDEQQHGFQPLPPTEELQQRQPPQVPHEQQQTVFSRHPPVPRELQQFVRYPWRRIEQQQTPFSPQPQVSHELQQTPIPPQLQIFHELQQTPILPQQQIFPELQQTPFPPQPQIFPELQQTPFPPQPQMFHELLRRFPQEPLLTQEHRQLDSLPQPLERPTHLQLLPLELSLREQLQLHRQIVEDMLQASNEQLQGQQQFREELQTLQEDQRQLQEERQKLQEERRKLQEERQKLQEEFLKLRVEQRQLKKEQRKLCTDKNMRQKE